MGSAPTVSYHIRQEQPKVRPRNQTVAYGAKAILQSGYVTRGHPVLNIPPSYNPAPGPLSSPSTLGFCTFLEHPPLCLLALDQYSRQWSLWSSPSASASSSGSRQTPRTSLHRRPPRRPMLSSQHARPPAGGVLVSSAAAEVFLSRSRRSSRTRNGASARPLSARPSL